MFNIPCVLKRLFVCFFTGLFVSACTGMADLSTRAAGMGVISQSQSTFDNETTIEVSPSWLYDPNGAWGNSIKLGAFWKSSIPEYIGLQMSFSSSTSGTDVYLLLKGTDISINGEKYSFESIGSTDLDSSVYNTLTKTIYTESTNRIALPRSLFKRMISAQDVRLRIFTSEGYEDSVLTIERMPGGGGTAILSLRMFDDKINEFEDGMGSDSDTDDIQTFASSDNQDDLLNGKYRLRSAGWSTIMAGANALFQADKTKQLYYSGEWSNLVSHIVTLDYGNDVHYFMLSKALYALGNRESALIYVNISIDNSGRGGQSKCSGGTCLGINLPQDALALREKIQSEILSE